MNRRAIAPRSVAVALFLVGTVGSAAIASQPSPKLQSGELESPATQPQSSSVVQLGPRPYFLVDDMSPSPLKDALAKCAEGPFRRTRFSIGHRGAPLQFPEHTRESYLAAARMGAGILECDVTFTKDRELVCRHSQCDLHTTTNILETPLAARCSEPFRPADPSTGAPASAKCCTSDITLAEFKTLEGKMDGFDPRATTAAEYLSGTPDWRTDLYAVRGTLMSHAESIALFQQLGVGMTPELKSPEVPMPYEGEYSQAEYAQQLIDDYKAARVAPADVWPQSFKYEDVLNWIENEPGYAQQAVYLDARVDRAGGVDLAIRTMEEVAADGVRIIAPPLWALVTLDADGQIVPSAYATAAKKAGLELLAWTLERSGPLTAGGGYYYRSVADAISREGDAMVLLDVLARDVGIAGIFTDWPATVTYYANCKGLE
ncbi:MAG TPA: glycerophosphodiester phosphodiesterase family protein [Steroidobacteraceae bacterium]|nr:glycerophosphodiester phosphodiesterase family protein [Steroidobacteraceae bacterium]